MSREITASKPQIVSMILNGSNMSDQDKHDSQAYLTIGQAILYNTKKRASIPSGITSRHSLAFEPTLPIYIGLNIHALTTIKKLMKQLHCIGISISYDRVLELEDSLAISVCERFNEDGVIAPSCPFSNARETYSFDV